MDFTLLAYPAYGKKKRGTSRRIHQQFDDFPIEKSINLHRNHGVFMDIPWFSHEFHGFSWVFRNMFPGFFDDSRKKVELSRYGSLWEMGAATELCLHLLSWWGRGWSRNDWVQHSNRFFVYMNVFLGVSWNGGTPKSSFYRWIFHYKPTIFGIPHL